jgi:hypothetical protein
MKPLTLEGFKHPIRCYDKALKESGKFDFSYYWKE